jgi:hypothetical protein
VKLRMQEKFVLPELWTSCVLSGNVRTQYDQTAGDRRASPWGAVAVAA